MPTADEGVWGLIAGSFVAGLFLTFTPCVLPMMPILSSIVVGQGDHLSKTRALLLSLAYVLGTAVTYAAMGALAGATGEQLQSYFENVWAIGAVSLLFALMALSMFGLFTIQLPSFIQSKLTATSQKIKGGSLGMVFVMGVISALVIGACVSPILIAFLGVALKQADPLLGAVTMFFMALGMGVPLILLGIGLGTLVPKAGAWMDLVKQIFGVLLLAVAIYFFNTLELISPLLVWGVFLIILSVYLGATEPLGEAVGGWRKFAKGAGIVFLLWGAILLIGAAEGEKGLTKPLAPLLVPAIQGEGAGEAVRKESPFVRVHSQEEFDAMRQKARDSGKMMIAFFSHDLCGSCKKYKATTFKNPAVVDALKRDYVAVEVNMTDKSDKAVQAIRKHFKVFGPPTFIFFDRSGEEVEDNRIYGYQSPDEFLDMLEIMAEE
jgi:thiol:disulfide interchange protein DsbD